MSSTPNGNEQSQVSSATDAKLSVEALNLLSNESLAKLAPEIVEDSANKQSLYRLRDLQKDHDAIYADYIREKLALEKRFEEQFTPLFVQRQEELNTSPFTDFWSRAFENCALMRENITERDAMALRYLADCSCETVTASADEKSEASSETIKVSDDKKDAKDEVDDKKMTPGSFTLKFKFRENPFFENDVLTKTYVMTVHDHEDLAEARGCKIVWKRGMDLTVRTLKKKTKNGRVFIKKQSTDSFFNFFTPPKGISETRAEADPSLVEELEDVMDADYELGECIRSEIIPRALLYFLDAVEPGDESDGDFDEDEDEEDDDDDDDDDDDEDADDDLEEDAKLPDASGKRSTGSSAKPNGKGTKKVG